MNNFEKLKSFDMDQLADWLAEHSQYDHSPWSEWFDKKYCKNCESIICRHEDTEKMLGLKPFFECAYCEVYDKCKFFADADDVPDEKETIKMWLESEVEE